MVSIPDFLNFLGCAPTNRKGEWLHYHSPFREDKHPSFWVNLRTGTCGDLAEGRIGDVVNLAARYYNCDNATAAANIADSFRLGAFSSANKHTAAQHNEPETPTTQATKFVYQPLQHRNLIIYAQKRGISEPTAKKYLLECWKNDKYYYLAFRNDNGGYALRNDTTGNYSKINDGTNGVTSISHNSDKVVIFEGFFDFLSWVEYMAAKGKQVEQFNAIILNSCSNLSKIINKLGCFAKFYLLLDNDHKGAETAEKIIDKYPDKAENLTPKMIDGYKDFNDYWVNRTK